jgi:hypothetical protein
MKTYTYTEEQKDEILKCILDVQMHLPWKKARCECEHINKSMGDIMYILEKGEVNENRMFNPVTKKFYNIEKRSSVYKGAGDIKGLWMEDEKE